MFRTRFIFLAVLFAVVAVFIPFLVTQAQTPQSLFSVSGCTRLDTDPVKICLQTPLGTIDHVSGVPDYLGTFYNLFVGSSMILSAFMIVIGGVRWLFARGNSGKIGEAKKSIGSAIMGMLLVFVSIALLRVINPDLLSLRLPKLESIKAFQTADMCIDIPPLPNGAKQQVIISGRSVPHDSNELACGQSYQIENATNKKCWGHEGCTGTQHCIYDTNTRKSLCSDNVQFAGLITWIAVFGNGSVPNPRWVHQVGLHQVCGGRVTSAPFAFVDLSRPSASSLFVGGTQDYTFTVSNATLGRYSCTTPGPFDGYLVGIVVNDSLTALTANDNFVLMKGCLAAVKDPSNKYVDLRSSFTLAPGTALYSKSELETTGRVLCNMLITPIGFPVNGIPAATNTNVNH